MSTASTEADARGRFITFEGIDGAGKSSHIEGFANALRARGHRVIVTREPGGSELAEAIRTLILNHAMSATTELLLAFAARADHLERLIRPALDRGDWVVCDRFTDSTYAYQGGGRSLGGAAVADVEGLVHPDLQPDLTIYFDLAPAIAADRRSAARAADRIEREDQAFFERVAASYRQRVQAAPDRFLVIDARLTLQNISKQLQEYIDTCL